MEFIWGERNINDATLHLVLAVAANDKGSGVITKFSFFLQIQIAVIKGFIAKVFRNSKSNGEWTFFIETHIIGTNA